MTIDQIPEHLQAAFDDLAEVLGMPIDAVRNFLDVQMKNLKCANCGKDCLNFRYENMMAEVCPHCDKVNTYENQPRERGT